MNEMPTFPPGGEPEPQIILIALNRSYWVFEGAEFLNPMLLGEGYYPVPVRCIRFETSFDLRAFLGEGRLLTDLWGINPDIVERLRRDNNLLDMSPPSA
jgi:hypothetical protein